MSAFGSNNGAPNDTGFQLRFNGATNPLAAQDLPAVGFTTVSGDAAGIVAETAHGGPNTNAGLVIESPGNSTPTISAPASVSIPLRTPFALTAEATDADGDDLIYLWEQNDRGGQGTGTSLVDQVKPNGPLFRVFGTYADVTPAGTLLINSPGENMADGNPTRTFPDIEQILINNTNATTGTCPDAPPAPASGGSNVPIPTRDCFSEWLPTIDYVGSPLANNSDPLSMHFRVTARDLDPVAGGYSFADTTVLIDNTAGPFLVNSKNVAAGAVGGRSEVVTWTVAGTDKPELAANVKISLSTDGGRTFPTVLAESTPNDGSQAVTWPNIATTTARIKIEAVDNVFFDVNNADFEIVPAPDQTGPETTITSGPADGDIVVSRDVDFTVEGTGTAPTYTCTLGGDDVDCADGTASFTDLLPGTYEFTATTTVAGGLSDATPASTTFTVPVDDVSLSKVKGNWKRKTVGSAYNGTLITTRAKGATLRYQVTDMTSLSLIAPTKATGGSVRVFLDGELLRYRSLISDDAKTKQVIPVADFDTPTSGTIRIVTALKKPVRIDGLGVVGTTS